MRVLDSDARRVGSPEAKVDKATTSVEGSVELNLAEPASEVRPVTPVTDREGNKIVTVRAVPCPARRRRLRERTRMSGPPVLRRLTSKRLRANPSALIQTQRARHHPTPLDVACSPMS
jgi:hypothetical protein